MLSKTTPLVGLAVPGITTCGSRAELTRFEYDNAFLGPRLKMVFRDECTRDLGNNQPRSSHAS